MAISHGWDFLILQGESFNTLDYWENIDCSAPYLRVPLIICFRRFPEEDLKMLANLLTVSMQAYGLIRPIFLAFSALVYMLMIIRPLLSECSLVSCQSLVSLRDWGSKVLGGTASRMQVMYRKVFSLPSCFIIS